MGYLYKAAYDLISDEYAFSNKFLPLKKKIEIFNYPTVAIYRKTNDGEGIYGFARILNQPLKTSGIPATITGKLYKRDYFQLPVYMHTSSRSPIIPSRYLFHFPSLNTRAILRPWNEFVLYWDYGLNYEIKYLSYKFPFNQSFLQASENEYRFRVHLLREKALHIRFFRQILAKAEKCSICFYPKPPQGNFFELHEITDIDFDKTFVPVSYNNFIVVCPNCHKLEHNKFK